MTTRDTEQNRGRATRKAAIIAAMVRIPVSGRTLQAVCTNISDLGMRLRFDDSRYFLTGHQIDIDIPVYGFVPALICWVNPPRVGIRFLSPVHGAAGLPWTPQPSAGAEFNVPPHLSPRAAAAAANDDHPGGPLRA